MLDPKPKIHPSPKKISIIVLSILGTFLFLLILFIGALPSILSTSWGNEKIAESINLKINGKIAFNKLQLSWFGPQNLEKVQLYDSHNQPIASLDKTVAKIPLWDLLIHHGKHGIYELRGFNAHIIQQSNGQSNIQQALTAKNHPLLIENGKQRTFTIDVNHVHGLISLDQANNRIQLSGKTTQNNLQGSFDVNISIADLAANAMWAHAPSLKDQLDKINIQANAINFPVSLLDDALSIFDSRFTGLLLAALGEKVNLTLQQAKERQGVILNLKVNSPFVQGAISGILKDNTLAVNGQNSVEMTLNPDFIERLNQFLPNEYKFQLNKPTHARLNLSRLNLILDFAQYNQKFVNFDESNMMASFFLDQADIHTTQPVGDVLFNKLDFTIDALGVSHFNGLINLDQILFKDGGGFQNVNAQGTFNIRNQTISQEPQSKLIAKITLTPDQFQSFRKRFQKNSKQTSDMGLSSPVQMTLNMNDFSLPLNQSNSPEWLKINFSSDAFIDNLAIKDRLTERQVRLKNIRGLLKSSELTKNISFSIDGEHILENNEITYPFAIKGQAENLFKSSGELNRDNLSVALDTTFQQFPAQFFGQFIGIDKLITDRISVILGQKINADIHTKIDQWQGPILANLSGENGTISLDGKINRGFLTLNKNFHSQIALTPEFGKVILEDIFPLAKGLLKADNPLTIDIEAKGFTLPLRNFDVSKVQVGKASLELGKVYFKKEGQLGTILSLFNKERSEVIPVWFTPLYLNINNGIINLQRLDMLIMDAYPIATWGKVNLASDKVNMIVGLTGRALKNGFNIQGLGQDYIMQIPYKGAIGNAAIDKKKAMAKIAALVASSQGKEGFLIGAALHIVSGGLSEEKSPSPTTNPLPWSTGEDNQ